jgi:hypothetical protein
MPGTELQALATVLKNASYRYIRLRDVPNSYRSEFARVHRCVLHGRSRRRAKLSRGRLGHVAFKPVPGRTMRRVMAASFIEKSLTPKARGPKPLQL